VIDAGDAALPSVAEGVLVGIMEACPLINQVASLQHHLVIPGMGVTSAKVNI
jgi:hypothetical protein